MLLHILDSIASWILPWGVLLVNWREFIVQLLKHYRLIFPDLIRGLSGLRLQKVLTFYSREILKFLGFCYRVTFIDHRTYQGLAETTWDFIESLIFQ